MRKRLWKIGAAVSLLAGASTLAACTGDASETTVFAAASLADVFTEIDDGNSVLSFGGSSSLVDQLAGGARADVFASADAANMDRARAEDLISGRPVKFATNSLVLVTEANNPLAITGLDDSLDGAKLVTCAPQVPCGRASQELAADLGVELKPVSQELSVTAVLGKVTSGEADAGLVYGTDAARAGDQVEQVEIPRAGDHLNEYWIALVAGGNVAAGQEFIDQVTGAYGQEMLADRGFGAP